MKATVKDGKLILEIDMLDKPAASSSGKTLLLATTGGNQAVQVGGQIAKVGINVFIPNPAYKAPAK